jgi:hypothetical protein
MPATTRRMPSRAAACEPSPAGPPTAAPSPNPTPLAAAQELLDITRQLLATMDKEGEGAGDESARDAQEELREKFRIVRTVLEQVGGLERRACLCCRLGARAGARGPRASCATVCCGAALAVRGKGR